MTEYENRIAADKLRTVVHLKGQNVVEWENRNAKEEEAVRGRTRAWTQLGIIGALQRWAREHGRPPRMAEWHDKAPGRPTARTVGLRLGSWNNALSIAGLPTIAPQGGRPH